MNHISQKFNEAFKANIWGNLPSRSGPGSTLDETRVILAEIPRLLRRFQIKTVLDIPCGDFFWMKEIRSELEQILARYTGADIVPELINQNRERYQTPRISFEVLNLVQDELPKSDLILTRDCLIHLSFNCIADSLLNAQRSGSTYLLASTYTKPRPNVDIEEDVSLPGRAISSGFGCFSGAERCFCTEEFLAKFRFHLSSKTVSNLTSFGSEASAIRNQYRHQLSAEERREIADMERDDLLGRCRAHCAEATAAAKSGCRRQAIKHLISATRLYPPFVLTRSFRVATRSLLQVGIR